MNTPTRRHRHPRKGEVVARAAVVIGLAAAIGLLVAGGEPAEYLAASAPCMGAAGAAPSAAL
jgi:hypothetical protein